MTEAIPACEAVLADDRLREECGVFAVYGAPEAAVLTALGLHALQHRGQEGCGIATYDGVRFHTERHLGLVGDHFSGDTGDWRSRLPGHLAIGHTRYGTQGGRLLRNVQPLFADLACGGAAIAHNGNLTNARFLREQLVNDGAIFQSTSDSEVFLQLMARAARAKVEDRFVSALAQVEGAYALVCLTNDVVLAARDPIGIRPLVLGWIGDAPVLASETCALTSVGARFDREIEPGEVITIAAGANGAPKLESRFPLTRREPRPCLFEYVYFCRPDSVVGGKSVYQVRKQMGRRLAEETAVGADVIVPVPDSGVPAALGYAERSGIPYDLGIVRSHYVGRTFIQPTQNARKSGVSMKHSINRAVIEGRRVVLVDDSIVRGTTSKQIVQMMRDAGAREVHFRSASPQILYGDYYGIDMPDVADLLAPQHNGDVDAMARWLNADSLGFLSVDGAYAAMGMTRDPRTPQFSDHCFTGDYPTRLVDQMNAQGAKDFQLSFLSEPEAA
ncbi:MAG: amidophosphoribosyltransferase [Hyphomonadaceae bacterium]|nr:amidophosphoribosyltransferase [Hyphomonadaceae bacterium]